MKFNGKIALVTGSGTGIGLAIAKAFVRNGASVIILGRRREPLEEAAAELQKIATECNNNARVQIFSGTDVSSRQDIDSMFKTLRDNDTVVDYIINNAGVSGPVTCFVNASMADFAATVDIHLSGTFWVSAAGLACMKEGGKIITISTFFTEERPLEQRPYRFRTPYTASQGAKNRLAEAMSWELVDRGIVSIATNPGPVHSDRIYKTVYPKAAAEFMRVGGFEDLEPAVVESAAVDLLPLLGEDDAVMQKGLDKVAAQMGGDVRPTLERLLAKIQDIAEKVQRNTSAMIADRQFLSQDQVAETVLGLCDDATSAIVNGKVIPGDRVFYPVRPHIGVATPVINAAYDCVVIVAEMRADADATRVAGLAAHIESAGGRVVLLMPKDVPETLANELEGIHSHRLDLNDAEQLRRWLQTASEKMGPISAVVHITGDLEHGGALTALTRDKWDALVSRFIKIPALVAQESLEYFVPGGGKDPRKFAGAEGRVIIVGPGLPEGRKISGKDRAKVEVFRGALRPFITTVNQELSDVLKSNARVFAILPGSVSGAAADHSRIGQTLDYLVGKSAARSGEVIFCIDETR